jgi:hypothetical protein
VVEPLWEPRDLAVGSGPRSAVEVRRGRVELFGTTTLRGRPILVISCIGRVSSAPRFVPVHLIAIARVQQVRDRVADFGQHTLLIKPVIAEVR